MFFQPVLEDFHEKDQRLIQRLFRESSSEVPSKEPLEDPTDPSKAELLALWLSLYGSTPARQPEEQLAVTRDNFKTQTVDQLTSGWGDQDKRVRGDVIRRLLLSPSLCRRIHQRGLTVVGGEFTDRLVLDYLEEANLRVAFIRCRFERGMWMKFAKVARLCLYSSEFFGEPSPGETFEPTLYPLDLQGSHIQGDLDLASATVGNIEKHDLQVHGRLSAPHLQVDGNVDAQDMKVQGRLGVSVDFNDARVGGAIELAGAVLKQGGVEMRRVSVGGRIYLRKTQILAPEGEEHLKELEEHHGSPWWDRALDLRESRVGSSVTLEDMNHLQGRVELHRADVCGTVRVCGCDIKDQRRQRLEDAKDSDRANSRQVWLHTLDFSNARIGASLLVESCNLEGALGLVGTRVHGNLQFRWSNFNCSKQHVYAINGDRCKVGGKLRFGRSDDEPEGNNSTPQCNAYGQVRFRWAKIADNLNLRGLFAEARSNLKPFKRVRHTAFSASASEIRGDIQFDEQSRFSGAVHFMGVKVGGNVHITGGSFDRKQDYDALTFRGADIRGDVRLGLNRAGFPRKPLMNAIGTVSFASAKVGGRVNVCADIQATLSPPLTRAGASPDPRRHERRSVLSALSFRDAELNGDLRFHKGTNIEGRVRLSGASIDGHLMFLGGLYRTCEQQEDVVRANRVTVRGRVFIGAEQVTGRPTKPESLRTTFDGRVTFNNAHILGFMTIGCAFFNGKLFHPQGKPNPPADETALVAPVKPRQWAFTASNARIDDGLFVRGEAGFIGEFRVRRSEIGHELHLSNAKFSQPYAGSDTEPDWQRRVLVNLARTRVHGVMRIAGRTEFQGLGRIRLDEMDVEGRLEMQWDQALKKHHDWLLDLRNAQAQVLLCAECCFPQPGRLVLAGFKYNGIAIEPKDQHPGGRENAWTFRSWLNMSVRQPDRAWLEIFREPSTTNSDYQRELQRRWIDRQMTRDQPRLWEPWRS